MTIRRLLLAVAVLAVLADSLSAASRRRVVRHPDPAPMTPERWVREASIPFATTEARSGLADLESLRTIVGDARIVSLGEATHGSREIFTMKHRILEYLVEKMGFTVFAIEANLPEADRVDDYVMHGIGDPGDALRGMYFWTWDTFEVLDMIEWMREYNLRRGDRPPVRFRGFDAQYAQYSIQQVEAYVARVDPSRAGNFRKSYDCIRPHQYGSTYRIGTRLALDACLANIVEARKTLESRRNEYVARSSAEEFERHVRYAQVVVQAENIWAGRAPRDAFMAANVEYFADVAHPGEKLVLWAHNRHVAADSSAQQGSYLRHHFGNDMVIFGFAFDRGGFTSIGPAGLGPQLIDYSIDQGWERFFSLADKPLYFLDLRNTPTQEIATYLVTPQTTWSIGSIWDPHQIPALHRWNVRIRRAFDVMIYIEQTTPSQLRPYP
jgi:erythromycin esterase